MSELETLRARVIALETRNKRLLEALESARFMAQAEVDSPGCEHCDPGGEGADMGAEILQALKGIS